MIHTTCSLAMEQVSIFRLRTGHNQLRNHLFHKLKISDIDQCRCRNWVADNRTSHSTSAHTTSPLRKQIWPDPTTMSQKLYGSLEDLATHCYLCCKEWRDHLTNEEEEEVWTCILTCPFQTQQLYRPSVIVFREEQLLL